jgi:hypothetical protein
MADEKQTFSCPVSAWRVRVGGVGHSCSIRRCLLRTSRRRPRPLPDCRVAALCADKSPNPNPSPRGWRLLRLGVRIAPSPDTGGEAMRRPSLHRRALLLTAPCGVRQGRWHCTEDATPSPHTTLPPPGGDSGDAGRGREVQDIGDSGGRSAAGATNYEAHEDVSTCDPSMCTTSDRASGGPARAMALQRGRSGEQRWTRQRQTAGPDTPSPIPGDHPPCLPCFVLCV